MRPFLVLAIICLLAKIVDCRAIENDTDENRRGKRRHRFSIEELLTIKFSHVITGDLDIDICKAGKGKNRQQLHRRYNINRIIARIYRNKHVRNVAIKYPD